MSEKVDSQLPAPWKGREALEWVEEMAHDTEEAGLPNVGLGMGLAAFALLGPWVGILAAGVPGGVKLLAKRYEKRMKEQADQIRSEFSGLERDTVESFFASEDGQDLLLHVFRETVKTASKEKRRWYAKVLGGAAQVEAPPERVEEILQALEPLSASDLELASEVFNLQKHVNQVHLYTCGWAEFYSLVSSQAMMEACVKHKRPIVDSMSRLARAGLIEIRTSNDLLTVGNHFYVITWSLRWLMEWVDPACYDGVTTDQGAEIAFAKD